METGLPGSYLAASLLARKPRSVGPGYSTILGSVKRIDSATTCWGRGGLALVAVGSHESTLSIASAPAHLGEAQLR